MHTMADDTTTPLLAALEEALSIEAAPARWAAIVREVARWPGGESEARGALHMALDEQLEQWRVATQAAPAEHPFGVWRLGALQTANAELPDDLEKLWGEEWEEDEEAWDEEAWDEEDAEDVGAGGALALEEESDVADHELTEEEELFWEIHDAADVVAVPEAAWHGPLDLFLILHPSGRWEEVSLMGGAQTCAMLFWIVAGEEEGESELLEVPIEESGAVAGTPEPEDAPTLSGAAYDWPGFDLVLEHQRAEDGLLEAADDGLVAHESGASFLVADVGERAPDVELFDHVQWSGDMLGRTIAHRWDGRFLDLLRMGYERVLVFEPS